MEKTVQKTGGRKRKSGSGDNGRSSQASYSLAQINLVDHFVKFLKKDRRNGANLKEGVIRALYVCNTIVMGWLGLQNGELNPQQEDQCVALSDFLVEHYGQKTMEIWIEQNFIKVPLVLEISEAVLSMRYEKSVLAAADQLPQYILEPLQDVFCELTSHRKMTKIAMTSRDGDCDELYFDQEKDAGTAEGSCICHLFCGVVGSLVKSSQGMGMTVVMSDVGIEPDVPDCDKQVMGLVLNKGILQGISSTDLRESYSVDCNTGEPLKTPDYQYLDCDVHVCFHPATPARTLH